MSCLPRQLCFVMRDMMLKVLKPTTILSYGRPVKQVYDSCKTNIKIYDSYSQEMKRKLKGA